MQRWHELDQFLSEHSIDIALINETHLVSHNQLRKFYGYTAYCCCHPSGNPRGGVVVLIKNHFKQHDYGMYCTPNIQASMVTVEIRGTRINIGSVYCPPSITTKYDDFRALFTTLGDRWLLGGDYNAKHPEWGSRLTSPRGRELYKTIREFKCNTQAPDKPTYWPQDMNKRPDIIDFFIAHNFSRNYSQVTCVDDLSSDHTPIILAVQHTILKVKIQPKLSNRSTDWDKYRELIDKNIDLTKKIEFPCMLDDAVEEFINDASNAVANCTIYKEEIPVTRAYPEHIRLLVKERRHARRVWQRTRLPTDKTNFNRLAKKVKEVIKLHNDNSFQQYLGSLSPTEETNYSLWKAARRVRRPTAVNTPLILASGERVSDEQNKANLFAEFLQDIFKPNDIVSDVVPIGAASDTINGIKHVSPREVAEQLDRLVPKKSPGPDKITPDMLRELPVRGIIYLTRLFNISLQLKYVPKPFKKADVIMIEKPGKNPEQIESYRPISLLSIIAKVYERIIHTRLNCCINFEQLIPDNQFGFREKHSTIQQVHRLSDQIRQALENREYCPATFLDVSRAFDRVWHAGLVHKLADMLPAALCKLLESYLDERFFRVRIGQTYSNYTPIMAGVPQGSVLGPTLYTLYIRDIPDDPRAPTLLFADDTVVFARHIRYKVAVRRMQKALNKITSWAKRWRIAFNKSKSIRVDYTLRSLSYIPSLLEGEPVPVADSARYLGLHLDSKLNWAEHVRQKRDYLNIQIRKYYWMIGKNSTLSLQSKRLLYKAVLKPIWMYGLQLWGSTASSNLLVIQRIQNKILRIITNAPWYVSNKQLHADLEIETVAEAYQRLAARYIDRLHSHPNVEAIMLLDTTNHVHRLARNPILHQT